ncbi:MAG: ATP-dependent Clp protease proteolytic subunit [Brevibacterium sp.]|uniref:ATP-dependent Clp protease proteolytic subunit n=1 Tax=Brevibacterium sp. TaxID=1701 RepID=UPI003F8ED53A
MRPILCPGPVEESRATGASAAGARPLTAARSRSYDRIFGDSLRDRWFTAEEGIEYGLIDRVIDSQSDL